jgi:hypothetical protein
MKMTARGKKLRKLVRERDLKLIDFRAALMQLMREFATDEDVIAGDPECVEFEFEEWYGDFRIVPAAFSIERNQANEIWDITVHVYELETTARVPIWKIAEYGRMADGDGPHFWLHIIDRYGSEDVLKQDLLARYGTMDDDEIRAEVDEFRRMIRRAQSVPDKPTVRKWKAAFDALREMGVRI